MTIVDLSAASIVWDGNNHRCAWKSSKPTILFVHAKWCGYCKQAMPEFVAASNSSSKVYFATMEDVILKDMETPLPVSGFPTFFMVDGTGKITKINFPRDKDGMIAYINSL